MHTSDMRPALPALALALALLVPLVPQTALAAQADASSSLTTAQAVFGSDGESGAAAPGDAQPDTIKDVISQQEAEERKAAEDARKLAQKEQDRKLAQKLATTATKAKARAAREEKANKVLSYDKELIARIGTQEQTGHTICCPSFSCAYADCVLDGTVHDHSYYTCSCCTWNDWGGGASSNRCAGGSEQLLREAYDQIAAGKPTVIHVTSGTGEHWIALIGYVDAQDPDHLELSNFIALDPWDGAQINAASRYVLYGDGCEHVSSR